MKFPVRFVIPGLMSALLLAGCGESAKEAKPKADSDPAVTGALADAIMVDPELAGQQGGGGQPRIELPPEQRTPEAIAAARAEAVKLAGGKIQTAPEPVAGDVSQLVENAATAAQLAAAAKTGKVDCAGKVQYSAEWATKLPAALSVYPQGAVQEAAGTDSDGCRLRVVSFLTAVEVNEVIDFYYTRARSGGYGASHHADGADHVLGGSKQGAAYLVQARKLDNGLTEVDLVASGG